MAKKSNNGKSKKIVKPVEVRRSAVRNSAIPRATKKVAGQVNSKSVPFELIAERAYIISISGNAGSQDENWFRAERELRLGK